MVPKRRPPSPHSCSRSRSPLRQCAAMNPSQVTRANSTTKTMSAVQLIMSRSSSVLEPIDDGDDDCAQDDPEELVPVEERNPGPGGFDAVVPGYPKDGDEGDQQQEP